jgi:hypothetical protein
MVKISCSSSVMRCWSAKITTRSAVIIRSRISVPVYIAATSIWIPTTEPCTAASSHFACGSFCPLRENLIPGTAFYGSCRDSGRFSGAKLIHGPCGDSRLGCPARAKLGRPFKLFPQPLISRCGPAGCDCFRLLMPLPVFSSGSCSTCPDSRLRGRHPLRCGLPANEN